jgi:hypothetical protein
MTEIKINAILDVQVLRDNIEEINKKAMSLKTKKAQLKAYDKIHTLERDLFILLRDIADSKNNKMNGRKIKAIVKRDSKSSEDDVFVFIPELSQSLFIGKNIDIASKSWHANLSCMEYKENQEIELEITYEVTRDFKQNQIVTYDVTKIHGGSIDMVEYSRLCNDSQKYSFFKYPGQNGVSGLFV